MTPEQRIELTILAAIAAHAILDMCKTTDEIVLKLKMKNAVIEFLKMDAFIKDLK